MSTIGTPLMMRWLVAVLVALSAGVATATLLGPLALDVIEYRLADDVLNQVVGGDAVGLALVVPAALAAAVLVGRAHPAGPVVALAPTGYAVYVYAQLAMGGEFSTLPGNSERFFPLFLAVFLLGAAGFVLAWTGVESHRLPELTRAMRRTAVTVLFVMAGFLTFGLHLPGLVDLVSGEPYGIEYTQSPSVFLIVKLMDLGIVVPLAIVTAVGLARERRWAAKLAFTVIGWGALLGSAVAGMAVVMLAAGDPAGSITIAGVFVVLALAFLGLTAWLYRPLFTRSTRLAPVGVSTAGPAPGNGRIRTGHR